MSDCDFEYESIWGTALSDKEVVCNHCWLCYPKHSETCTNCDEPQEVADADRIPSTRPLL